MRRYPWLSRRLKLLYSSLISLDYSHLSNDLIFLLFLSFQLYFWFGPHIRLAKFSCHTPIAPECPDFVIPELEKYRGHISYLVQSDELASTLIKLIPTAESVVIKPAWPNLLQAEIIWQSPTANLGIPASTSALLISQSGKIIKQTDFPDPNLPLIIASSAADLIISDHLTDTSLLAALDSIKYHTHTHNRIEKINVFTPQDIQLNLQSGHLVIITSLRSVKDQVHKLQLILSQATMIHEISIIDLRLDRPVLKP